MHSTTTDKGGWCVIWGGVLGQVGYRASPDRRAQVPALRPANARYRSLRYDRGSGGAGLWAVMREVTLGMTVGGNCRMGGEALWWRGKP